MSAQKRMSFARKPSLSLATITKYNQISKQVREVFYHYADIVEPVSIDEAYLDVTENKINCKSAIKIAQMIQADIWEKSPANMFCGSKVAISFYPN